MKITIRTETVSDFFKWNPNSPVRGTEEFYVQSARHLAGFNHDVVVEKEDPTNLLLDNVSYIGRGCDFGNKTNVRMICNPLNSSEKFDSSSGAAFIWTNLFGVKSIEIKRMLGINDSMIVCGISKFHLDQLDEENVRLVPHGVSRSEFENDGSLRRAYELSTGRRLAIFSSSPDRGMGVMLGLKDELEKHGVDLVTSRYPTPVPGQIPMTNSEITTYYKTAHYWLHPGIGNELFCLSAAKAQVAGCCPIVRSTNALDETVQSGFKLEASASIEDYQEFVIECVRSEIPPVRSEHILDWRDATKILEGVVKEVVDRT